MADNETTADIIAWLRRPREGENAYLTLWRDEIADRLEAAHKRERGEAVTDSNQLREALKRLDEILYIGADGEVHGALGKASEIERTIKAALAETEGGES